MIVFKRRLLFWLLKAYIKRWGKIAALCFFLGLVIFFILKSTFPYIIAAFTGVSKESDGMVGTYTLSTLPPQVIVDISEGLTTVDSSGQIQPGAAASWEIKNNGKTYIFHLKNNLHFADGTLLTSKDVQFPFADVKVSRPSTLTIVYSLQDSYSPFLVSVSRPIFKDGLVGLGAYRVKKIQTNGSFVQSLTLTSSTSTPALKIYAFYPTQEALKVAYTLGEITRALTMSSMSFQNSSFDKFPHTHIVKSINYTQLVTLFYNTDDKNLSDKKLRDALSYALPNNFSDGQRATTSIPPSSIMYDNALDRPQDLTHAKLLLQASLGTDTPSYPKLTITTLPKYKNTALIVQSAWKALGLATDIQLTDSLPQTFQIYLGNFNVPLDPDQYTLWHSYQENNITNFKSTRIDKLLEDGRKTSDTTERIKIYQDFQKYLQDEQPASFLYFPYNYVVSRT